MAKVRYATRTQLVERDLMEAQSAYLSNLVDPYEDMVDVRTGELWGYPQTRWGSRNIAKCYPYQSIDDVSRIREFGRNTFKHNPYGQNFVNSLCVFTVGAGHEYNIQFKPGIDKSPEALKYQRLTQIWMNKTRKINCWMKRQRNTCQRYHRDGEAFIRLFPQDDGWVYFRYIEPSSVFTPKEYIGGKYNEDDSYSLGIKNLEDDAETIEFYFVNEEEVDASLVQHRKANVDLGTKRGLSSYFVCRDNLDRAVKLLRNMSILVTIQASIAMIRKHSKAPNKVENFATAQRTLTFANPYNQNEVGMKQVPPGQILDVRGKDMEYEFPTIGVNPSAPVAILAAECRAIASSRSMPEYMVGSDASNANYASTMVAESPAVRMFETEQAEMIEDDLELFDFAWDHAVESGLLPPETREVCEIEATGPTLVIRDSLKEAQTYQIHKTIGSISVQDICAERGLNYDKVQQNRQDHEDKYGNLDVLPGMLPQMGFNEDIEEDDRPRRKRMVRVKRRKRKLALA